MGQIEKFWCLSDREFPEFFKNGPTFYSSSTQWPSVTIFHKSHFFLGHPVYYMSNLFESVTWGWMPCVMGRTLLPAFCDPDTIKEFENQYLQNRKYLDSYSEAAVGNCCCRCCPYHWRPRLSPSTSTCHPPTLGSRTSSSSQTALGSHTPSCSAQLSLCIL